MAYSSQFQYDVFISWSREDNQTAAIDHLAKEIKAKLTARLGQPLSFFVDLSTSLGGALPSGVEGMTALQQSAVFLPLLSPSYLNSRDCMGELESFFSSLGPSRLGDSASRLVPVSLRPVEEHLLPGHLAKRRQIRLWQGNRSKALRPGTLQWESAIDEIASAVEQELRRLHGEYIDSVAHEESAYSNQSPLAQQPPLEATARSTKKASLPPELPTGQPSGSEPLSARADDPAMVDELGRRPFAEVLAARMEELWRSQNLLAPRTSLRNHEFPNKSTAIKSSGGFMIHIHGPWGSGKTSILNFLQAALQSQDRAAERKWVVIEFNGWQQQRARPPWWTLIREVYLQALRQLDWKASLRLRARWWWWCLHADWLPVLATTLVIAIFILVTTGVMSPIPSRILAESKSITAQDSWIRNLDYGIRILTAILAASAGVFTFSRTMIFGSARAAQTYKDLRADPLRPIVKLFQDLATAVDRPVAIFIDDLDRCESQYVVELLEGIQTLFRNNRVGYVIAADRKWLCTSFERNFENFGKTIGDSGRSLGYLFLEKMFQISVSIPQFSIESQRTYWRGLLQISDGDPRRLDAARVKKEKEASEKIKNVYRQEDLNERIKVAGDPVSEQAMRVAAAKQISRPEAKAQTQHRLERWVGLIEQNPRSMKRLVNAYAMQQAIHFLEGREVSPEALAQWTILELRWPILADFLSTDPAAIHCFKRNGSTLNNRLPAEIIPLLSDMAVFRTIMADGVPGTAALSEDAIRELSRPSNG